MHLSSRNTDVLLQIPLKSKLTLFTKTCGDPESFVRVCLIQTTFFIIIKWRFAGRSMRLGSFLVFQDSEPYFLLRNPIAM